MKPFHKFTEYLSEHVQEIAYDSTHNLQNVWNENITLSKADVTLITQIAQESCLAILRAYHHWAADDN